MKIFYVTLNTVEEARQIARDLLERRIAVCCNWLPITCAYRWADEIKEEPEIVLLVKTQAGRRAAVEEASPESSAISIASPKSPLESVNATFLDWLDRDAPPGPES